MRPAHFLLSIWGEQRDGYFCLSTKSKSGRWRDVFFQSPVSPADIRKFIEDNADKNLYFCPTPFDKPKRKKEHVIGTTFLWADLDECDPRTIDLKPQAAWQSSPGRYAALWRVNAFQRPDKAEEVNRSLSYAIGADKSGWDLTQVLRIPGTRNYKYANAPIGKLLWITDNAYGLDDFPDEPSSNEDPRDVLALYRRKLRASTLKLLTASKATVGKRSEVIWKLENELNEQGVTREHIFLLIKNSVWNKFAGRRDEDDQLRRELAKLRDVDTKPALAGNTDNSDKPVIVRLSDVEPEQVEWVWYPYIPRGKLTILEGDPGLGKSWLTMALATHLSQRKKLPEAQKSVGGRVLIMSAEDGLADTIRPRLDTMEANVRKIFAYDAPMTFGEEGCEKLREQIEELRPQLVLIDPLVAYLGGDVDMHKANETREVLARMQRMAEDFGIAIVAVRHLTKGGRDKSIYRGIGSIDITAAARSVLLIGRDPEEDSGRVVVHIKSNLAPLGRSIRYELRPGLRRPFRWAGACELSAEEVMKVERGANGTSETSVIKDFLQTTLANGPQPSEHVKREAEARGITITSLIRVARDIGVQRGSEWRLKP